MIEFGTESGIWHKQEMGVEDKAIVKSLIDVR